MSGQSGLLTESGCACVSKAKAASGKSGRYASPVSSHPLRYELFSIAVLTEFLCSRRNAEIRFKRTTGHSILQELLSARIERAKTLLSQTSLPIPEIAASCGYKFPAHFRNAFRAATGLNPLAWRKQQSK